MWHYRYPNCKFMNRYHPMTYWPTFPPHPFQNQVTYPQWCMSLPPPPALMKDISTSSSDYQYASIVPVQFHKPTILTSSTTTSIQNDCQSMAPTTERLRCFMQDNPNQLYQLGFVMGQIPKLIITPIQLNESSENTNELKTVQNKSIAVSSDASTPKTAEAASQYIETSDETFSSPETSFDSSSLPSSSENNSENSSRNLEESSLPNARVDNIQFHQKTLNIKNLSSSLSVTTDTDMDNRKNKVNGMKTRMCKVHNLKNNVSCYKKSMQGLNKIPSRRSARLFTNMLKEKKHILKEEEEFYNLYYYTYFKDSDDMLLRISQNKSEKHKKDTPLSNNHSKTNQNLQNKSYILPEISNNKDELTEENKKKEYFRLNIGRHCDEVSNISTAETVLDKKPMCMLHMFLNEACNLYDNGDKRECIQDFPITTPQSNEINDASTPNTHSLAMTPVNPKPMRPRSLSFEDQPSNTTKVLTEAIKQSK